MGRILEALKKSPRLPVPVADRPFLHTPGPDSEPLAGEGGSSGLVSSSESSTEEIPFIEVGPHRSMEASPSVLAASPPANYGPRLAVPPCGEPVTEAKREKGQATLPTPEQDEEAPMPRKLRERALDAVVGSVAGAEIPRPRLAPELIAYYRPDHAISQQYRKLLAPLLSVAPESRSQVLLFTAARPGSGTTTVLLNVALTAAGHGRRRVVVVDGNLRRPALADKLGLGAVAGLREVLGGTCSLEHALRETDQRNLFALTAGIVPASGGVRFVVENGALAAAAAPTAVRPGAGGWATLGRPARRRPAWAPPAMPSTWSCPKARRSRPRLMTCTRPSPGKACAWRAASWPMVNRGGFGPSKQGGAMRTRILGTWALLLGAVCARADGPAYTISIKTYPDKGQNLLCRGNGQTGWPVALSGPQGPGPGGTETRGRKPRKSTS